MISNLLSGAWAGIAPAIGNHLWQSTLFAGAAGLLTLALRRNRARARYWVWLAASLKFLAPFSLLAALGREMAASWNYAAANPALSLAMEKVSQPFDALSAVAIAPVAQATAPAVPAATLGQALPAILAVIWLCGFAAVLAAWCMRWRRVSALRRAADPLFDGREVEALRRIEREAGTRQPIPILLSKGIEPGIFGIFRPVLLWPAELSPRLDDAQLDAILAHELSHVRRRDNLVAALHLLVEAAFWFYPVVWWLGGRLVEERERACDEAVIQRGNTQHAYAEGILKVCQFCIEAPAGCVAGVSGADLKQRIRRIMTRDVSRELSVDGKLLLIVAALAAILAPLAFGVIGAAQDQASTGAQTLPTFGPEFRYAVTSIKPDKAPAPTYTGWTRILAPPLDEFRRRNVSAYELFCMAYLKGVGPSGQGVQGYRDDEIFGAPAWFKSDRYDVDAKIEGPAIEELQKFDWTERRFAQAKMLRELLADRFALKAHYETREIPVYILTVAKGGPKLKESTPGETFPDEEHAKAVAKLNGLPTSFPYVRMETRAEPGHPGVSRARFWHAPISTLAGILDEHFDRQVVDETGLSGRYDFTLRWATGAGDHAGSPGAGGQNSGPAFAASSPLDAPPLTFSTVEKELGLKLKAGKARLPVIVIDHVEKPSEN
ncbi:MAG TPA: M56 family metallopeptidase [Candidatus Acidoferrales bacterium]|nr:M56 family metallopeptidase [Candidatus Acidoferrales bacterium]